MIIKAAAEKVMQRGLPSGVGLDGFDSEKLEARLWEVINNGYMVWLTKPLLLGLIYGGRRINHKTHHSPGEETYTIITWVCQYKNLKALFGYSGEDDMVALALSAGADVSFRLSNGCNALFFAVKYGSARTVELLLDAGVKIDDRDFVGRNIWKNALERPDLDIIQLIIDRCNDLIPLDKEVITIIKRSGERFDYTLPEIMIFSYIGLETSAEPNMSWKILGAPRMDDLATALIRLLQAGAQFSQSNTTMPTYFISCPLAFVTHVDTLGSNEYTQDYSNPQLQIARMLRDVIYGRWLPDEIMKEVQSFNKTCSPDIMCPICLSDMCPSDNPITLYCGHRFCLECIKECGKARNNRYPASDKRCPICRRLLCGDVLDEYHKQLRARYGGLRLGIDRHEASGDLPSTTRRGPHLLSDEQLRFECSIMIGRTEGTRESLLAELLQFQATHAAATFAGVGNMRLELSSGKTLKSNGYGFYAPRWGPVMLPIKVNGVPILASISSNSIFTVIPKAVVKTFGLKTKPIRSSQFVSGFGTGRIDIAEVVDEFRFFLKDVEICLNNAVVLKKEKRSNRIQLGIDFFHSALWTRSSVQVGGITNVPEGVFVVSDGFGEDMFLRIKQPDELRYYSRHGKICQVPFIYINHMMCQRSLPVVSLLGGSRTKFGECQWCCRFFPCDGMLKCDDGTDGDGIHYYCDEDCKSKGMATRS